MPAAQSLAPAFATLRRAHVLLQRAAAEFAALAIASDDEAMSLQHALADIASTIREDFPSYGEAALEIECLMVTGIRLGSAGTIPELILEREDGTEISTWADAVGSMWGLP